MKRTGVILYTISALLLIVGLFMFFIGSSSGISYASWVAFFPTTIAIIYLLYGRTTALAFAPHVSHVLATDLTEEMLEQVRRQVKEQGLGIHLVRKMVDSLDYEYADRNSTITIRKSLDQGSSEDGDVQN